MIPPYDNVDVLSGQGTCGLEMLEQVCQALLFLPGLAAAYRSLRYLAISSRPADLSPLFSED
jgi:hypothetical protein